MEKEEPKQTDEKGRPMTYWGGLEEPEQDLPIVNGSYGCTIQTKEQETLEEAIEKLAMDKLKSKQERSYSEEDLKVLISYTRRWGSQASDEYILKKWFEQFKKK